MKKTNQILHFSLFAVSTYMSVMMFIIIGNSLATKIALALLALIFELTKLSDLHKIPTAQKSKFIYITSYTLKGLLSVVASVGLILTLLSAQGDAVDAGEDSRDAALSSYDAEVDYWEREISQLDLTVEHLNDNLERNPSGWSTSGESFVSQITAVQQLKVEYREKYKKAIQDRVAALSAASMANIDMNYNSDIELEEVSFELEIEENKFVGFLDKLKSTKMLEYVDEQRREIIYDPREIINYRESFSKLNNPVSHEENRFMMECVSIKKGILGSNLLGKTTIYRWHDGI